MGENMDIYYEVIGSGYPIICLHGNGEDHHIFDDMAKELTGYKLILIDSRYHGKSTRQGELSYKQMMKDVLNVIDELKIDVYDLIGFSDGGIVSLLLGMADERVQNMIIIGANTKPQMIKPIYRFFDYLQMLCLLPFCLYHPKARRTFQCLKLMETQPHIEYHDLEKIKVPVLILAGEQDMIKEIDTMNIKKHLIYSVLKIIKGGNHFLLKDSFQQTIKEIQLFLNVCHKED